MDDRHQKRRQTFSLPVSDSVAIIMIVTVGISVFIANVSAADSASPTGQAYVELCRLPPVHAADSFPDGVAAERRIAKRRSSEVQPPVPDADLDEAPAMSLDDRDNRESGNEGESDSDDEPDGNSDSGDQNLGQAPPSDGLQFLRRQTVLLKPGQWQFDTGLVYTHLDNDFPVPLVTGGNVVNVVEGHQRRRLLLAPLEFRYGWRPNVQLFANMPVGWANSEFSFVGYDEVSNIGGIGDVNFGASVLLRRGCADSPDIIGTFSGTAPTGNSSFPLLNFTPNNGLGEGYWAGAASILFVQNYDPVTLFYGAGYRHRFEHSFAGTRVQPGEQVTYQLGVGFAVNETVTLSSSFLGSFISETYINRQLVSGTVLEPMRLRFAATVARCNRIIEPFAEIGMTDSAPNARVGIVWTF